MPSVRKTVGDQSAPSPFHNRSSYEQIRCCQVDPFGDHFGCDCIWRQTVLKTAPNECRNIIQLEQFLTVWAEDQISSTDDSKRQGITVARSGLVQMKALFGVRDQPEVEL